MIEIFNPDDTLLARVSPDDDSYRRRAIMEVDQLVLMFSALVHIEIPVGAYCEFQGSRYTLMRPEQLTMHHTRDFEYTATFEGESAYAKIWKFRCLYNGENRDMPTDGRLKFSLTATPREHLQMFVDNMNARTPEADWTIGNCIEGTEKVIGYDHAFCLDALSQMAEAFETEWSIEGRAVSLCKTTIAEEPLTAKDEKGKPVPLSYGRGRGFKPNVGRSNYSDVPPIETLFVQGGDRNIDRSRYGSSMLHLPLSGELSYDGEHFEDEDGFDNAKARLYKADALGSCISRADKPKGNGAEESLDLGDVYPSREGTVSELIAVNAEANIYDFTDESIPDNLDYSQYRIAGEKTTILFQSGELAGKEFDLEQTDNALTGYVHSQRRFKLVSQDVDGVTMPSGSFIPKAGDKYAVFGCMLPDAYISDPDTKTGAEWDMMRKAVAYLYEHEEQRFTFSGTIDGIWAKNDWANIGGKLRLGGNVSFIDERFQKEAVLIRVIAIKDYLNNPHSPEVELSNDTVSAGFTSRINQIKGEGVIGEQRRRDDVRFTKRGFRDAAQTAKALEELMKSGLGNFSEAVSPIAVNAMQLLIGDQSLQLRFVDNKTAPQEVSLPISYDPDTKKFSIPQAILQHMTLGIDTLSSAHKVSEYRFWDMEQYESAVLDEADKKYWVYAVVQKSGDSGYFELSERARAMDEGGDYYNLLLGLLNTEYEGARSFARLYGFTEVLPGRITTDQIASGNYESGRQGSRLDLTDGTFEFAGGNLVWDGNKLKLRGTLVQSGSGATEYLGCFRGAYDASATYYRGDEVTYVSGGCSSTYRYTSDTPRSGIVPTNSSYWKVVAQGSKGADGQDGTNGRDGIDGINGKDGISPNTSFKSIVFKRSNSEPSTPTGGSYATPVPSGWSDGVPSGEARLWASTRVFSSDGQAPQQSGWTTPRHMTDTADFDVEYSSVENPTNPTGHPNTNTQWSNTASEDTIWLATSRKRNGEWDAWQVSRIKGEKGADGVNGQDGNNGTNGQDGATPIVTYSYYYGATAAIDHDAPWQEEAPAVLPGQYLWTRMAVSYSDGRATEYSYFAQRIATNGIDGQDGKDGQDGVNGPAITFRGNFDATKSYFGTSNRCDVVYYDNQYWIANSTIGGEFAGTNAIPSDGSTYWLPFGASFDSIATGLLLAEEANIGGWVFRNNRLEAQNGSVYLDGINGKVRINGTMQLSTACESRVSDLTNRISDVNIFYLPSTNSDKSLFLGQSAQDIGKVCRLFNSGGYGQGSYRAYLYEFHKQGGIELGTMENTAVLIPPQSCVEFTCFEIPKSGYDYAAKWIVTNRFEPRNFITEGVEGRYPSVIAMGRIIGSSSGVTIGGEDYKGRDLSTGIYDGTRLSKGDYKIKTKTIYTTTLPRGYKVFLQGVGTQFIRGSVEYSSDDTYFTVHLRSGSTAYDGSVEFMILSPYWWYNMA